MFPASAKPHEIGILIARLLLNIREPRQIANMFHYRTPRPVEKVLHRHRVVIQQFYVSRDARK